MTTKDKVIEYLTDKGMSSDEAEEVFKRAVPELERSGRITWHRPADEYPDVVYITLFVALRRIALIYIDETCPLAWFRPMFSDD